MSDDKPHWTLDRRIPLALILAIFLQSGSAIWWAAGVSGRLGVLERDESRVEADVRINERAIRVLETGSARQEERLNEILRLVQAIDKRLNQSNR